MSPPTAAPPIARATLTVAALGLLLMAQSATLARLDPTAEGFFASQRQALPLGAVVRPVTHATAGWLLTTSLTWVALRTVRRRVPWEAVAAAGGAALWPAVLGASSLLAITLGGWPPALGLAAFWTGAAASVWLVLRSFARIEGVGGRGAAIVVGTWVVLLAIATTVAARVLLPSYRELVTFGVLG